MLQLLLTFLCLVLIVCTAGTTTAGPTSSAGPTTSAGPTSSAGPTTSEGPTTSAGPTTSEGPTTSAGPTTSVGSTSSAGPTTTGGQTTTAGPTTSAGPTTTARPTTTAQSTTSWPKTTTVSTTTTAYPTTLAPTTSTLTAATSTEKEPEKSSPKNIAEENPNNNVTIAGIVTGGVVFSILIAAIAGVCVYRIKTSLPSTRENQDDEVACKVEMTPVSLAATKVVGNEYEELAQTRQSTALYEQPQSSHQEGTITYDNLAGGDQHESKNVYEHPLTSQQQEMPNMYGNVADIDQRQSTACQYEHPLPPQPDESNTYDDISIKN